MSTATVNRPEWCGPGAYVPEVIGKPQGPEVAFVDLAERCAAGNWPSEGEAKRILNAAGRSVPDLVGMVANLRRSRSTERPADVPVVAKPVQRKPKAVNVTVNNPAPAAAPVLKVANVATQAEQSQDISRLQQLEKQFTENQDLISRMGVTREQYLESAMRTDLMKRGIDPRSIGLGQ